MKRINPVVGVIVIALWLPLTLALAGLFGCNTSGGTPPYPLTDTAYQSATNVVTAIAATAHASSIPGWAPFIEALAAAVLALLAAWQGLTHRRVVELEQQLPQTKKDLTR